MVHKASTRLETVGPLVISGFASKARWSRRECVTVGETQPTMGLGEPLLIWPQRGAASIKAEGLDSLVTNDYPPLWGLFAVDGITGKTQYGIFALQAWNAPWIVSQ